MQNFPLMGVNVVNFLPRIVRFQVRDELIWPRVVLELFNDVALFQDVVGCQIRDVQFGPFSAEDPIQAHRMIFRCNDEGIVSVERMVPGASVVPFGRIWTSGAMNICCPMKRWATPNSLL